MPFGSGQRTCIGRRLALLQIKVVLIELLKKFTFIRSGDTEVNNVTTAIKKKSFCFFFLAGSPINDCWPDDESSEWGLLENHSSVTLQSIT